MAQDLFGLVIKLPHCHLAGFGLLDDVILWATPIP